jgi:cobalt-zinc-cadmium efflux system membrane fusion protein
MAAPSTTIEPAAVNDPPPQTSTAVAESKPTVPAPTTNSSSRWLHDSIPTLVVLVALAGLAFWGHHTGWTMPKFSSLSGGTEAPAEIWCEAHGVPDAQCVECKKSLMPPVKDFGWCREHHVHQCAWDHPEVAQLDDPPKATKEDLTRVKQALALTSRPLNNSRCKNYLRRIQFASSEAVEKAGLDVTPAWQGPIVESIIANGQISNDPTRVLHVASPLPGKVSRVKKNLGDHVEPGDTLALIDAVEVGKAKAELLHALAQVDVLTISLERKRSAAGALAARDIREAEAALREANVRLKAVHHTLANFGLDVDLDELKGLDEGELNRRLQSVGLPDDMVSASDPKRTTANLLPILATIAGVITYSDLVPGEVVDTNKELFIVTDARRMWLTLDVKAEEGRFVKLGQAVQFRPDNGDNQVVGEVSWISPAVDEKTRTLRVRANLDNNDGMLRAFTFGVGRIVLRKDSKAVLVPNEAVQTEGCCNVVFVRDKGFLKDGAPKVFHVREVQIGAQDESNTELIAGILPGEIVATKGSGILRSQLLRNNLGAG